MARRKLSEAQLAALARGRKLGAAAGGRALAAKEPPATCPDCGRPIGSAGYNWYQWLGHRGLHGLADSHFGGDLKGCQNHLMRNGWARQDPASWNGAFRPYVPVAEAAAQVEEG